MCWWKCYCVALYVLQPSIRSSFPLEIGVWGSFYFGDTFLAAKYRFFRPPVTWRALTRNVTLALKRGGWELSEGLKCSQHIFAPKIFTWLEDEFLFFSGGQVRPILRGEMAVSFSCKHLLPVRGENFPDCLFWNIIYRSICIQPDVHIQYTYIHTLCFSEIV